LKLAEADQGCILRPVFNPPGITLWGIKTYILKQISYLLYEEKAYILISNNK